jgi:hypothetical protein
VQRATLLFVTLLIVFWCVVRLIGLEQSPPGSYVDEAAGATNIICFAQDNTNESGEQFLLFTRGLGGGFFTPAYLYIGNAWVRLFGVSIASFRSIAAFFCSDHLGRISAGTPARWKACRAVRGSGCVRFPMVFSVLTHCLGSTTHAVLSCVRSIFLSEIKPQV